MRKDFSHITRKSHLILLEQQEYDLAIIGGGITGAGVARDAASRGMKVALIEANDFASGTSSRSSKLIHGGIRYLENLEFHLVFEALSERKTLFEMAPHLVHPLRFVIPLYQNGRVGMGKMGLGMLLYDMLSLLEAPELHERHNAVATRQRVPILQPNGLLGSYVYSDAYMDDDRLVLETLRSASQYGARCVNYVKATGVKMTEGSVSTLTCKDMESDREFEIKAKHFISTVGPWTDQLGSSLFQKWKSIIRPTKGIHFTLSRDQFPLKDAVVMATDSEKRIIFGIPRHEMVIIGTTDTDYSGDPSDVAATSEDVDYLLKVVDDYFPNLICKEDIISTYAGVRPLVDDGSQTEGDTSREHTIIKDPRNVTFAAGGKYTTYRKMAEDIVEAALSYFPIEAQATYLRGQTREPLNSATSVDNLNRAILYSSDWAKEYDVPEKMATFLCERHGGEAESLLSLSGNLSLWEREAHFAINNTMCTKLLDFYLRRTPLYLSSPDHGISQIEKISQIFANELQWNDQVRTDQINQVKNYLRHEQQWR